MNKADIERCMQEVIAQANKIGIPISKQISPNIVINTRAKSRFASCKQEKSALGRVYIIEIGNALIDCDPIIIKDIIAHEILHTCHGCLNHGIKWKLYAEQMNQMYGYHIKRTSSYEELGISTPIRHRTVKYVIVCQKCGATFERQKKSKLVLHTKNYRCRCGGRLELSEK